MDLVEPEVLAQLPELVGEECECPLDVRPIGAPAAELVVEDDGPLVREPLERPEVVVRRARPAVEAHERRPTILAGDAVPRPTHGPLEEALHGPDLRRVECSG